MSFNNGPRTVVTGLSLLVDAADPLSYPGSGTSWTDIVTGITGSLSGSITYASDFKGTLVVNDSSSVIIFPTSSGNFGTDSFTVELAFQPNQINGQHWLISKNSGSLPTWGAFITGSGGSGRITAFFNVSSTISCSMSTPIGSIVTGSNYLVDINFLPGTTLNTIYLNSELSGSNIPNGGGSLTATSSLFISNRNSGSSVGTPLDIFNTKLYTPKLVPGLIRQNYNSLSTRLGLFQKLSLPIIQNGLLDLYPGASVAYSLRLLNSDYGGAAIQVRRSSDNAVANIGFTSNGDLDTNALLAHCGSSDGFVTEWYDQSGNGRNATQATAINQPQIVSGGVILTQTGIGSSKPILRFDGINDSFDFATITTAQFTTFYPSKKAVNTDLSAWFANSTGVGAPYTPIIYGAGGTYIGNNVRSSSDISYNNNNYILMSGYINSVNNGFIQINNSSIPLPSPPFIDTGTNNFNTICARGGSQFSKCDVPEMIFYAFDNSANISAINTNINTYYGIY